VRVVTFVTGVNFVDRNLRQTTDKNVAFLTNNVEKTHVVALHFDQQIEMVKAHARRPFLGLFG